MHDQQLVRFIVFIFLGLALLIGCSQFLTEPNDKKVVLNFTLGYGYNPDVTYFIKSSYNDKGLNKKFDQKRIDQEYDLARVMVLDFSKYRTPEDLFSTQLWTNFESARDSFYLHDTIGSWTQWKNFISDYFPIVSDQTLTMTADSARGTVIGVVGLNRVIVGFTHGDTIKYEGEIDIVATEEGSQVGGDELGVVPYEPGGTVNRIREVIVSPDMVYLAPGETWQFHSIAIYEDQTRDTVTNSSEWSNSPGLVGRINTSGLYAASTQQVGLDTVVAIYNDSLGRGYVVVELEPVLLTGLEVSPAADNLIVGQNRQFTATGFYSDGSNRNLTNQAAWSLVPNYIGSINTTGLLTTVEPGQCMVIASFGGFQDSADVLVEMPPVIPVRIEISPRDTVVFNGQVVNYHCIEIFSDSSRIDVTSQTNWSLSTQLLGSINSNTGEFTASTSETGLVTVIAEYGGFTAHAQITVEQQVTMDSISVAPVNITLITGQEEQFNCTVHFSDGSTQDVTNAATWNTTPGIAGNISATGLFTANIQQTGTETITAQYQGFQDQTQVTVVPLILVRIEISPDSLILKQTETYQMTCMAVYSDSSTQDVTTQTTWDIDPGIGGTISGTGLFTADDFEFGVETIMADYSGFTDHATVRIEETTTGTMTDQDGNVYQTVKIGNQWWMAENLKTTHYQNGDPIPNETDGTAWTNLTTGAYCNYDNDNNNAVIYGSLYNWYAVGDNRSIAPQGWHVPTDAEWKDLEMFLGMIQYEADLIGWRGTDEGGKLKETGTTHWQSPNTGATNESGFSALPGGYRVYNTGNFSNMGNSAYFWSSTEYSISNDAWYRSQHYTNSGVYRYYFNKLHGFSVRLIKD